MVGQLAIAVKLQTISSYTIALFFVVLTPSFMFVSASNESVLASVHSLHVHGRMWFPYAWCSLLMIGPLLLLLDDCTHTSDVLLARAQMVQLRATPLMFLVMGAVAFTHSMMPAPRRWLENSLMVQNAVFFLRLIALSLRTAWWVPSCAFVPLVAIPSVYGFRLAKRWERTLECEIRV